MKQNPTAASVREDALSNAPENLRSVARSIEVIAYDIACETEVSRVSRLIIIAAELDRMADTLSGQPLPTGAATL